MTLVDLLRSHQKAIAADWFRATCDTYPDQTAKFLKSQANQFANPVGGELKTALAALLEALLAGEDENALGRELDRILKIRAVQEFSARRSVAFVTLLKGAVRKAAKSWLDSPDRYRDLLAFEARIDDLCLLAFDVHMQWRERIYDLKANEVRKRSQGVMERFAARIEAREKGAATTDETHYPCKGTCT